MIEICKASALTLIPSKKGFKYSRKISLNIKSNNGDGLKVKNNNSRNIFPQFVLQIEHLSENGDWCSSFMIIPYLFRENRRYDSKNIKENCTLHTMIFTQLLWDFMKERWKIINSKDFIIGLIIDIGFWNQKPLGRCM